MFIYTKNKDVIKKLEIEKCPLLKKRQDGFYIYAIPPTLKTNFIKQEDTVLSDILTF